MILASSILTRAEWGWLRVMPFKWHLILDTLGGVGALIAPWALGFSGNKRARNTFLVMSVFALRAGWLSQSEEME